MKKPSRLAHRRFAIVLIAVLLTSVCFNNARAQTDSLIVPGVRVGSVRLGTTESALYAQLGGPSQLTSEPGSISYIYHGLGLYIYIDKATHKVFEIDVAENTKFHTAAGTTVGMTKVALRDHVDEIDEHRPPQAGGIKRIDFKNGMTFSLSADETIYKISVWIPGGPHF